jgi:hypothetical protein
MLAIKAVVKGGMIKPLESIGLPKDKEIVIYECFAREGVECRL